MRTIGVSQHGGRERRIEEVPTRARDREESQRERGIETRAVHNISSIATHADNLYSLFIDHLARETCDAFVPQCRWSPLDRAPWLRVCWHLTRLQALSLPLTILYQLP